MKRGLFIIVLLSCAVFAEDHYVTQSGTGDGSSGNPWSVADFNDADNWDSGENSNNGKIGPGDTVYFSGTITTELEPKGDGSAGNYITLDGYENGQLNPVADHITFSGVHVGQNGANSLMTNADWVPNYLVGTTIWNWKDGSKCVVQTNTANTVSCSLSGGINNAWNHGDWFTIEGDNIDLIPNLPDSVAVISPPNNDYAFFIQGHSYIIVEDFEIDGRGMENNRGIYSRPTTFANADYITVRRNYIHDVGSTGIEFDPDSNYGVQNYITIGGAPGDGNFMYNCQYGQSSAIMDPEDAQGSPIQSFGNDLIISYNEIGEYWQYPLHSAHLIQTFSGNRMLMEYNTLWWSDGQGAICPKENHRVDGIIRGNKIIQGGAGVAISISTTQNQNRNFWVYGNAIFSAGYGIRLYKDYDDIYVFSNVMTNIDKLGLWVGGRSSGDNIGLTRWYNNAVYRSGYNSNPGSSSGAAMRVNLVNDAGGDTPDARVENNIFMNSDLVTGEYDHLYLYPNVDQYLNSLDFNTYYNGEQDSNFYQYGVGRMNLAGLQARGWEEHGDEMNPGFIDPDGPDNVIGTPDDDLRLNGAVVDNGIIHDESAIISIQGVDYYVSTSLALNPSRTEWTATPPLVEFVDQNDYGSGWERGAYVYDDMPTSCSGNGFYCCQNTCLNPVGGNDCSGVCCASESDCVNQGFLPDIHIEAEAGQISAPIQVDTDSRGTYIHTLTDHQGKAEFIFNITEPGSYYLQARIIAPTVQDDSFYCFLDDEILQDEDYDSWDTIESSSWVWVNVTKRGDGGMSDAEFNPMVWNLDEGLHKFTIQGRETGILLDKIILKPFCTAPDIEDIVDFVAEWLNGDVEMTDLIDRINRWRDGC